MLTHHSKGVASVRQDMQGLTPSDTACPRSHPDRSMSTDLPINDFRLACTMDSVKCAHNQNYSYNARSAALSPMRVHSFSDSVVLALRDAGCVKRIALCAHLAAIALAHLPLASAIRNKLTWNSHPAPVLARPVVAQGAHSAV